MNTIPVVAVPEAAIPGGVALATGEAVAGQRAHVIRATHSMAGSRRHAAARAERQEAGMEALLRAHLLAYVGRIHEAFDHLRNAIAVARAGRDETLALTLQLAHLRMVQTHGQEADAGALRAEILSAAESRGISFAIATDEAPAGPPRCGTGGGPAIVGYDASLAPEGTVPAPASLTTSLAPWAPAPIRIRTLGGFSVQAHGRGFPSGRKVPHKPLALLQAIIAFGGASVSASLLVDALWPDADGACGRRALDVALLRLRRLLQMDEAIVVCGGKLSLDRELCWVDAWAFERTVESVEQVSSYLSLDRARALAERMVELYRGRFLGPEEDRSWMLPARDRLSAKFARGLTLCARALADSGLHAEAEALYRRGLELDNLSEALYRGLMECCRAQGHCSEALSVYRRCRELLSIVFNTRPSADTELLRQALLRD
ncbi:MAG: bacterial transcriptional activator domain-containing protein [Betaproteobacteria bacterium]